MKKLIYILIGLFAIVGGVSEAVNTDFLETASTASTGIFMLNAQRAREVSKNLRTIEGVQAEISQLIVEQVLSNTQTQYTFDFSANAKDSAKPREILLPSGDVFVVTSYGVFLYEKDTTNPRQLKYGHLQTYINIAAWTANQGFNPADLNQVYAGNLSYKVGANVQFENQPLTDHVCIPQTQFDGAGIYDSIEAKEAGYVLTPSIIAINAEQDAKFVIDVPAITNPQWAHTLANKQSVIVMVARGLKVRQGSKKFDEIMAAIKSVSI